MDSKIRTAMFLAAGLGTRMRPLSLETPKPLIKVNDKALMDYYLDQAVEAGVERVIVNVHWLPEQVEAHMSERSDVEVLFSDERDELLETGGAIVEARDLLGEDPIFMVNTDAFFASGEGNPFRALNEAYNPDTMDDLLLLADRTTSLGFPGPGDFYLLEDGQLDRRGERETAPWAYAGARITRTGLYDGEAVRPFSANIIWNRSLSENRLFGLPFKGQWMHVGEPATIDEVETWMRANPTA